MKSRAPVRLLALLPALALAPAGTAPAFAEEVTRTVRVELPAADAARFAVENLAGTMRIGTGRGETVSAVATIHAADRALADAVRFERVEGDGGVPTLRVRYPAGVHELGYPSPNRSDGWPFLDFFSSSRYRYDGGTYTVHARHAKLLYADVDVRVPARVGEATFRDLVGRLEAENVEGKLAFAIGSADARLARVSGEIRVQGTSGDVRASEVGGDFESDLTSGDCELDDFHGERVVFHANSGDVRVRNLTARRLEVETTSGDARIAPAEVQEFAGHANSGDIQLELSRASLTKARIHTSSGDVRLRLPRDAAFEATARQGSGDIRVDWDDAVAVTRGRRIVGYRRGTGGAEIEVETGSGDFVLAPR